MGMDCTVRIFWRGAALYHWAKRSADRWLPALPLWPLNHNSFQLKLEAEEAAGRGPGGRRAGPRGPPLCEEASLQRRSNWSKFRREAEGRLRKKANRVNALNCGKPFLPAGFG
jgi:hypothetical protein